MFAVSSKNPTKNFPLVLRAARLLPHIRFVIAGGSNSAVFVDGKEDKMTNVTYTGYVSDEQLISLYRHAAVFVYPSLYEGFGIPPLEALSQGCPIIVSDCASLPEVCRNWADYCRIDNAQDLVHKIEKCIGMKKIKDLSDVIKNKYSWQKTAKIMLNIIKDQI